MAVRRLRIISLICGVMALGLPCGVAEEPPAVHKASSSVAATASENETPAKLTPEQLEKKKKAYIGLVALAGIVIVGVALGALTIIWAGRLRRQLRKSDPKSTAMDRSFWFLKPQKPSVKGSSLPELNRPIDIPPPPSEPQ